MLRKGAPKTGISDATSDMPVFSLYPPHLGHYLLIRVGF